MSAHLASTFGQWLRQSRKGLDLTQAEFARRLGCSRGTVRKLESGELRPSKQLAEILARQLTIPEDERETFVRFARSDAPTALPALTPRAQRAVPWRATPPARGTLPLPLTSFIGRAREIAELKRLLGKTRLLSLTGAGGSGKTRLALEVAGEVMDDFADGVYFVPLAPIDDPALLMPAMAQTLGVQEVQGRTMLDSLKDYLRQKHLLLVLDNLEQLLAAAPMLTDLLETAPHLTVLATSRERLRLSGERDYAVAALPLPDPKQLPSPERLTQYAAVQLFVERAQAVKADFALTAENAQAIAEICVQLDGLPLAIELASARVRLLTLQKLLAQLSQPLRLLTGGARDLPARQRTLRATLDWSYDLLTPEEQALFRRLAVFVGGWTLEAAEAVCGDGDVLEGLQSLLDKNLLTQAEHDGEPRYGMLQTVREYALEQLRNTHAGEPVLIRHLEYYLRLVEQTEPKLQGSEQIVWLKRLDRERDNLRLALEWSLNHGADSTRLQVGLQLAAALWRYWFMRGDLQEGRRWLELALARSEAFGRSKRRAQLLNAAGCLAWLQGDFAIGQAWLVESGEIAREVGATREHAYALGWRAMIECELGHADTAQEQAGKSVELFREVNDRWGEAHSLFALGRGWLKGGADATARPYYDESLSLFRELGDKWGIAVVVGQLGVIAGQAGDYAAARALLEQRLALAREIGSKQLVAFALYRLGLIAHQSGDDGHAAELFKECLALAELIGLHQNLAEYFSGLALVAEAAGHRERAARLLAAAEALGERLSAQPLPAEQEIFHRGLTRVRAQLSRVAFAAAWAEGRALPLKRAIEYALETTAERQPPRTARQAEKARYGGLTTRERQIAALVAQGKSNREIAEALVVSERTVTTHIANVLSKLGFSSRTQVAAWAVEKGLVRRQT